MLGCYFRTLAVLTTTVDGPSGRKTQMPPRWQLKTFSTCGASSRPLLNPESDLLHPQNTIAHTAQQPISKTLQRGILQSLLFSIKNYIRIQVVENQ